MNGTGPHRQLRARRPLADSSTELDDADVVADSDGWFRPGGTGPRRRARATDARRLAAIVIAYTLLPDRDRALTHDEAGACGLADDLYWH
ncbi:hypothetical protein AD006_30640 (plasmid) [Pseudonocardia sp. EC080610-09]|uniref:hypothetical protein n=1 Tax=unclassified Pseudonocardia TaxID=2619320 RepID=UPI000706EC75|nr:MULTISPECIES: hypothetical protein [unclassified Pseudonocardia]ALL79566.1 hypothetical protein AD006_30640 [Pseudonocardia sp. EC080610-09]ALL85480.1 hypothetical protein AD017_30600 [Pseudonocardia sp. EC080619-01]